MFSNSLVWDKAFKNGPSKICGRQPLKNLKGYGLLGRLWLTRTVCQFIPSL